VKPASVLIAPFQIKVGRGMEILPRFENRGIANT
jgi:hypothetical protein